MHIPFCRQKCHYCNFFSITSGRYRTPFFETLEEEIFRQRNYLSGQEIGSVYLGGGTPSLADMTTLAGILGKIRAYYPVSREAEITIEANPDDLSPELLRMYRQAGINRLSIGVQSFFENDLRYLNRIHSADQALQSIRCVKEAGFTNFSIDLIYGIPTLSQSRWEKNLETAFLLDIPHISAYALTVEPQTGLDVLIRKKKLPAPAEDETVAHFRLLQEKMRENGYEQYEISNFCTDHRYSVHNSNYWKDIHYLGLGPSAHSYDGISRQWNISSVIQYIEMIRRGERHYEKELLTPEQKFNEYVMVSLRTCWGCDLQRIREAFGTEREAYCASRAQRHLQSGDLELTDHVLFLTDKGKILADAIASDLFI